MRDTHPGEFEVNEKIFIPKKMAAMTQFHVARRLAPLIEGVKNILPMAVQLAKPDQEDRNSDMQIDSMLSAIKPFADMLASMSDADVEYIVNHCLEACSIIDGGKPARIRVDGRTMYEDLGLNELVTISFYVLKFNLSGFIATLQSDSVQSGRSQGVS